MSLIVQKFGGTSLGTTERIRNVAERIHAARDAGDEVAVVCSAMGHETDRLLELARAVNQQGNPRELDLLLASGEQVSVALVAMALQARECPAKAYLGAQVPIITEDLHGKARIKGIDTELLRRDLAAGVVPVIAGFQGVTEAGDITTMGRGGSDTTAVAIAVALEASECQIFTDVEGVYTTDPRLVSDAQLLRRITFEEMLEMAGQGSQVLQLRSVEFAGRHNLPLRVMPSGSDGSGTLITYERRGAEAPLVSGIAFNRDEAVITVTQVPHRPGMARRILAPVSEARIEVDMIVLNAGRAGCVDLSFTVHRREYRRTLDLVQAAAEEFATSEVLGDDGIVKVAVVGVGMRSHAGVATTMFDALAAARINVRMVSTSEIKIAVLLDEPDLEVGVRVLHAAFGLSQEREAVLEPD